VVGRIGMPLVIEKIVLKRPTPETYISRVVGFSPFNGDISRPSLEIFWSLNQDTGQ
jgi:hypothetical protein